jgi:hypothetical protein
MTTLKLEGVVEWLTLLLRIREVPESNLGSVAGYSEGFRDIPGVCPGKFREDILKIRLQHLSSESFSFSFTSLLTIRFGKVFVTKKLSLHEVQTR